MADLNEENTSKQETPALTEAISAILSEVKDLKEQVTSLKESVDLIEVHHPEVEENPVDDEDNVDSESLSARIDRLDSTPAKQAKDSMKSLLQDIASELDLSERTDSPVDEGLAKSLSLLKDKLPEEKSHARIDKCSRPENVEGLRTQRVNPLIWNQLPVPVRTQDSKKKKRRML